MAKTDSNAPFGTGFDAYTSNIPFLKNYVKYKQPEFAFEPGSFFNPKTKSVLETIGSGDWTAPAPADVSKYGIWSPEDALDYQKKYSDILTQQQLASSGAYIDLINKSKMQDLALQARGLNIREASPSAAAQRGYLAAQNLAAGAGAEASLGTAIANQLIAAKQGLGYRGSTFGVG